MLKTYIVSVIVWMIIIYCASVIFETGIKSKGWCDDMAGARCGVLTVLKYLFILAAVPIMRVFVVIIMSLMATHTKDELTEMFASQEEDDE